MQEVERARAEAQLEMEEAVKDYVVNFLLTEEYQPFSAYLRNFVYAKVVGRVKELYTRLNVADLMFEFLDELPHTPAEDAVEDGMDQEDILETRLVAKKLLKHPLQRHQPLSHYRLIVFSIFIFCNGYGLHL